MHADALLSGRKRFLSSSRGSKPHRRAQSALPCRCQMEPSAPAQNGSVALDPWASPDGCRPIYNWYKCGTAFQNALFIYYWVLFVLWVVNLGHVYVNAFANFFPCFSTKKREKKSSGLKLYSSMALLGCTCTSSDRQSGGAMRPITGLQPRSATAGSWRSFKLSVLSFMGEFYVASLADGAVGVETQFCSIFRVLAFPTSACPESLLNFLN